MPRDEFLQDLVFEMYRMMRMVRFDRPPAAEGPGEDDDIIDGEVVRDLTALPEHATEKG